MKNLGGKGRNPLPFPDKDRVKQTSKLLSFKYLNFKPNINC